MNRRQTKKVLKQALQAQTAPVEDIPTLLGEIQTLAYRVNTETKFCVFTDFQGHVAKDEKTDVYHGQFEMRIGSSKENWSNNVADTSVYLGGHGGNPIRRLVEIRDNLQCIVDHGKMPYDRMYEVEVTSTEYRLG